MHYFTRDLNLMLADITRQTFIKCLLAEGYDTFINHVRSNRDHLINPQKSEITIEITAFKITEIVKIMEIT